MAVEVPKRKKRRKYSPDLALPQRLIRGVTKGGSTFIYALSLDLNEWRKSWDKEARRRKNGALRAIPTHFRRATRTSVPIMKAAPAAFRKGFKG